MRLLELILLLACAAFGIRSAALGRSASVSWIHGMQMLLAAVLIAQIVVEGWRWQMFPTYAATLLVAAAPSLIGLNALPLSCSAAASFGLLAASVLSCLVFPFVQTRAPHGPFAVGLTTIPVSIQRPPDTGPDELQAQPWLQLWYPAQAQEKQSTLISLLAKRASAQFRAAPIARASADAPVAQAGNEFPVVIYFDGWPEDKIQNSTLIQDLASRGFAVAAVTYRGIDRPLVDYSSEAGFEHSVQLDHSRARLHARDAIAVLDALARLAGESGNRFEQRLDTEHTATLGFSFGGAIAAEASRLDPRIKAAVNLDGRHWGDALARGVSKPYMFICEQLVIPTAGDLASADPMTRYEARLDQVDYSQLDANQQARGGVRVTIPGLAHMNFTDVPLRSPLRRLNYGGRLDPQRAQLIIQTYVVEFLSRYLRSANPPPLDSPMPGFPEALVQTWLPPADASR
jgi:dienelactone hydrolase